MDGPEHIPPTADDSTAGRLACLERRVELLRQSVVMVSQALQELRDMTVRGEAAR